MGREIQSIINALNFEWKLILANVSVLLGARWRQKFLSMWYVLFLSNFVHKCAVIRIFEV